MSKKEYECEHYDEQGPDFQAAWDIMRLKMKAPPSLDVFLEGLKKAKTSPQVYAQHISDNAT